MVSKISFTFAYLIIFKYYKCRSFWSSFNRFPLSEMWEYSRRFKWNVYLGYFPSTAKKTTCYFAEDLSIHWHHFQHLSPSTSVKKYVESLEEVTKERGGVCLNFIKQSTISNYFQFFFIYFQYGTINRTHFSRVGKEFEYFRHKISTTVLSCRIMYCEACGEYILAVHIDGNFKLYRWINSSQ